MVTSFGKDFIKFGSILSGSLDIVLPGDRVWGRGGSGLNDPLNTKAFALFEGPLGSEDFDFGSWEAMELRSYLWGLRRHAAWHQTLASFLTHYVL